MKKSSKKIIWICAACITALVFSACGQDEMDKNLLETKEDDRKIVNLYSPMEKSNPEAKNVARSAFEETVTLAEERLDVTMEFHSYTAENYKEKTYDDVTLQRARNGMDDLYLLNPDTIQILGSEGRLLDLSELSCVDNLREVVKTANTVNGRLVAIPQEIVAYGLFVNKDMFDQYGLALPQTPEDLLECCRVFQENGIKTPIGANRWWLETIVFAQAYADLYNGGNTEAEIAALNKGERKYSDYMRPAFAYLKELMDRGYIDAKTALVSEAMEAEGPDFRAQKTPIVMAYWSAANADTAYGKVDFNLQVIGFPSSRGQMPVVPVTGFGIGADAEHLEDAKDIMEIILSDEALLKYTQMNKVISPSKNVEVACIPALEPLNDRIKENIYVLGSNAGMKVEQWGNTCQIVRKLLGGATVEECMAEFDRLQEESLKE